MDGRERGTMPAMSSELYDALLAAGAPEDKARAAATAALSYEDRFDRIERKLVAHDGRFTLLQWMLFSNLAISVAVLFKVFFG
jgi:hypothetical protein